MIKMKKMNHILRTFSLVGAIALLSVSCSKTAGEGANVAIKRQFDAWLDIHYPDAKEQNGVYVIDETPGTGLEWRENLGVTFLTYTARNLDGTVSYNTDEQWAKQLGTWDRTHYYGPQIMPTGESVSYAGIDAVFDGMRQGGTRTAIIPSWMMTRNRYDAVSKYLDTETDVDPMIFSVTFLDQTENLADYEFRNLKAYAQEHWNVSDTLSTGAVFFKSFTEFENDPEEMPQDTTVYINYIGRRVWDGQVFDTTIADTAKVYHIYNSSKTYKPISVTWGENATDIKMGGNSTISGFAFGLHAMHAGEKASFAFGYNLGYGSSGGSDTDMIPPYASLRFDVELVPEP